MVKGSFKHKICEDSKYFTCMNNVSPGKKDQKVYAFKR